VRTEGIWLRFLSGPDIESLGISRAEIIDAVAEVVTAHGRGRAVAADAGTMLRYH
jgi:ornithine cyclodeaminase